MPWLPLALVGLGLWLVHDGLLPARPRTPRGPSRTYVRLRRHARHRQAVLRALPEAIDRLRDSLASVPLDVALARLGTEAGPEALRPHFRQLGTELALGVPFAPAVQHWADGLADQTADRVASALVLHDRVGAQRFATCLGQLAGALRADLALRDQ